MGAMQKRTDPTERWRPVRGFEGRYEVSTMGRVRKAWPGAREPRILSPHHRHNEEKALYVVMFRDGKRYQKPVLRIVAETFLNAPPRLFVVHRNGLHSDNRLVNVAVMTSQQVGREINYRWGCRPVVMIDPDGEIVECYRSSREAARQNHISESSVRRRCNREITDEFGLTGYSYRWDDGL